MTSVTQRIAQIKQPYGGYLKPKDFNEILLDDGVELYPEENINAGLVGTAVDYLTRYAMGTPAAQAFDISLRGASIIGEREDADFLLSRVRGLDDLSIRSACKLVGYDVCTRVGIIGYKNADEIHADEKTIFNIRTMVNRSLAFFEQYGPIIKEGFTFELGYTPTVTSGDGDFLTEDTLWDFKVSKNKPTTGHTLQLLMYYILGIRSMRREFHDIKKLGIYNPRFNKAYLREISKIDSSVIKVVASDVVGV
ncbi:MULTISPECIES: hypothetical protein [Paenibacillus]|uniref:Uncharacterized protein n=1 Tax=Paenibacillus odorifer TaxID=189426 RepID=A0ABX3HZJ3_9BACL|nr:hypothetical protein [Paenibacillus odorifer]OMD55310.1 hypothetical protein BSK51_04455 [Paenibacillus odorifer]